MHRPPEKPLRRYRALWPLIAGLLIGLSMMGCSDPVEEESETVEGQPDGYDTSEFEPGPVAMRKLTQAQYANSIFDVLGDDLVLPNIAEPDVEQSGLLSVGASQASVSPRGVESYEEAALILAEQALRTSERQARLVPCQPTGVGDRACAEQAVTQIGQALWRRPLSADERERLTTLAISAAATYGDFFEGLEAAVAAMLQSPWFLYRIELGEEDPDAPGTRRFTGWDLASRLSYFLWNTTPDAELLRAAEAGELSTDAGLRAQAERLLASPRAREGVRNLFSEQFHLHELDYQTKDAASFEHYSSELGADAREETLRLLEHIVFDVDADFRDAMTTRTTFINPRLAALYDVPAPSLDGFAQVNLPEGEQRAGLLGHASLLSLNSHPIASSATLRGYFVRTVLLCQQIPPPPVNVDTSIPEPSGMTRTLRDRVAEHLEDPSCAGCHDLVDPIGLGLENFDALGRWRDTDNGAMIDPSGELDGAAFLTPDALGAAVRDHEDFAPCVVKTTLRYALGRRASFGERGVRNELEARFARSGYRVKPLLLEVVMSPMFRLPGEVD